MIELRYLPETSFGKTTYAVGPTGFSSTTGERYPMPPVCLVVRTGSCVVQDYLTPDEARALANELMRQADIEDLTVVET